MCHEVPVTGGTGTPHMRWLIYEVTSYIYQVTSYMKWCHASCHTHVYQFTSACITWLLYWANHATHVQPIAFGVSLALLRKVTCNLRHLMHLRHPIHRVTETHWVAYSLLHLEFYFSILKSQSMILFLRSLLTRSVEKRPRRLRLEFDMNWHSKCNRV